MKKYVLLLIYCGAIIVGHSQNSFLSFTASPSSPQTPTFSRQVEESPQSVTVTYLFHGGTVSLKTENNIQYQSINIEGFSPSLKNPGSPQLPVSNDMLIIPQKTGLNIQILDTEYIEYNNYTIYPTQPSKPETDTIIPFYVDSQVYQQNQYLPTELVSLESVHDYRDINYALLQVSPLQYNPATRKIRCYSKIKYKLSFSNGVLPDSLTENLGGVLSSIINPKPLKIKQRSVQPESNYIIITTDKYLSAVNRFARWKQKLGFKTKIISRSAWTSNQVKDSIYQKYAQSQLKPEYLLIVGDWPDVPGTYGYGVKEHPTDNPYVCMGGAGDYIPDMARGRIAVNTIEEANIVFDKIINYEKNPTTNDAFYSNATISSYFERARNFIYNSEQLRTKIMNQGYAVDRIYYTLPDVNPIINGNDTLIPLELRKDIYPYYPWDGDYIEIARQINEGRFLFIHRDHGEITNWLHPYFSNEQINLLNNIDRLPVIFSIDCLTGHYNVGDCFAENLLKYPLGGCVGMIAASELSNGDDNDILDLGLIDNIWPSENSGTQPQNRIPYYSLGKVLNQGFLYYNTKCTSLIKYKQYQVELYHYFGDPSMEIYTAKPLQFTNINITSLNGSVTINTGVSDCKITIFTTHDMGNSDYRVIDNSNSYTLSGVTQPYYISITKHNYIPKIYMVGPDNLQIQNHDFEGDVTVIGNNITIDRNANSMIPTGDVKIEPKANVLFQYTNSIIFGEGFECETGGTFETEKR